MTEASPTKPWWRRWFGDRSERAAARYLRGLGHRIVARNWRCSLGELDLVTLDQDYLVFVEVRSTEDADPLRAASSVRELKQRRLTQLALAFLQKYRLLDRPTRFDVLAISWSSDQRQPKIEHFTNAFEAVGRFQMHS
jgi:putative endonuclease